MTKPRFFCGYDGVTTYEYHGKRYEVRYCCDDDPRRNHYNYTPEEWQAQVVPTIGTIMNESNRREFPPAEVVAHFPDAIPARFNADFTAVEYDGPTPEILHTQIYRRLIWKKHVEDMAGLCHYPDAQPYEPKGMIPA